MNIKRISFLLFLKIALFGTILVGQSVAPSFWKDYKPIGNVYNGSQLFELGEYNPGQHAYPHTFRLWFPNEKCSRKVSGAVSYDNGKILFHIGNQSIVYFDFNMKVGEKHHITLETNVIASCSEELSYWLMLENISSKDNRKVFKFRFSEISLLDGLDLVFFVELDWGVIGIVLGDRPPTVPYDEVYLSVVGDTQFRYCDTSLVLLDYKWNAWDAACQCWDMNKSFK